MPSEGPLPAAPSRGATLHSAMHSAIGESAYQDAAREDDGHHNYFCSSSLCHRRFRHHYRRQSKGGDRPLQSSDQGWLIKRREQGGSGPSSELHSPRPSPPHWVCYTPQIVCPRVHSLPSCTRRPAASRLAAGLTLFMCPLRRPGRRMVSLGKVMAPKPVNLPSQKCVPYWSWHEPPCNACFCFLCAAIPLVAGRTVIV